MMSPAVSAPSLRRKAAGRRDLTRASASGVWRERRPKTGARSSELGARSSELGPRSRWWGVGKEKESADKPGFVEDNHSSAIRVAAYLQRPTRESVWATHAANPKTGRALPYLVLLRAGFAVPPSVTTGAVRSYRTLSPLPSRGRSRALRRFTFCCTFRGLASPRRYLAPCPRSPDFPPPLQARAAVVWPTRRR
jgi:hypothetical protein